MEFLPINIDRRAVHHRCYEVVDGEYPAAPVLSIGRLFIEIPRRPLPPREGAAFVAIKALKLCDALGDPLQRLAGLIDGVEGAQNGARPILTESTLITW